LSEHGGVSFAFSSADPLVEISEGEAVAEADDRFVPLELRGNDVEESLGQQFVSQECQVNAIAEEVG
jgi:hypothetical protein